MPGLRGPSDYSNEPPRHPSLKINAKEPFNAEPRRSDLIASYITPVDMFYKRNHGPIPIVDDVESFRVSIHGLIDNPKQLSMTDIRNLPKYNVTATLQCAGNRRTAMSKTRTVKGVGWDVAALGNATWGGAKLSDVLELVGICMHTSVTALGGKHVEFISVDKCKEENGGPYKASIPLSQATNPDADVLLAYEMNGEVADCRAWIFLVTLHPHFISTVWITNFEASSMEMMPHQTIQLLEVHNPGKGSSAVLNRDHGYPLRVVVPGVIGARSVKWLDSINVIAKECQGFFMQKDYKMFPPSVDWNNIDWSTRRPQMDFPVQCAICSLEDVSVVKQGKVTVSGYAVSGGGRGIERVDISVDGGKTWVEAFRYQKSGVSYIADGINSDKWAWVLFEAEVDISQNTEIIAKAVDSAANVQPENVEVIWNLRGILNTSWHRVYVQDASKVLHSNL